jgi:hypothetical protein
MFTSPEAEVTTVQAAGKKTSTPGTSPGSNVQSGISPGWSTIAAADAGAAGSRSRTAAATMRRMALARCLLTTAPPVGRVEHFYPNPVQCTRGQVAEIRVLEHIWGTLCSDQQLPKVGGWLSEELANEIVALAEQRRIVGYVRRPLDPATLMSKIAGMGLPFENEEKLVSLLLGDAGRALRTTFRLAYSPDEGLWS